MMKLANSPVDKLFNDCLLCLLGLLLLATKPLLFRIRLSLNLLAQHHLPHSLIGIVEGH